MTAVELLLTGTIYEPDTPIAVELHQDGGRVTTPLLSAWRPYRVDLPPGLCGLRALLPSGAVLTRSLTVTPGRRRERYELRLDEAQEPRIWGSINEDIYATAWVRLWRLNHRRTRWRWHRDRTWSPVPWPAKRELLPQPGAHFQFRDLPDQPHVVQFGCAGTATRMVRLPPTGQITVTLRPAAGQIPRLTPVIKVDGKPAVEALRGYLALGAIQPAELVAGRLTESTLTRTTTDSYRFPSFFHPAAMIPLGRLALSTEVERIPEMLYVGLRSINRLEPDYADSDLLVLRAWLEMAEVQQGSYGYASRDAQDSLLRAASSALPSSLEMLRLLAEGLDLYITPEPDNGSSELLAARARVRRLLAAADQASDALTVTGQNPDLPLPGLKASVRSRPPKHAVPLPLGPARTISDLTAGAAADVLDAIQSWQLPLSVWAQVDQTLTRMLAALRCGVPEEVRLCARLLSTVSTARAREEPPPGSDFETIPATLAALLRELRNATDTL